jgi:hypothetical protein
MRIHLKQGSDPMCAVSTARRCGFAQQASAPRQNWRAVGYGQVRLIISAAVLRRIASAENMVEGSPC